MAQLIEVRKLAAVDMAWLGPRLVIAEYALGVLLPVALGIRFLAVGPARAPHSAAGTLAVGVWLVCIGVNYVPLLAYALDMARSGAWRAEGRPEFARARRYGMQQFMLVVPLLVAALAIAQKRRLRSAR